MQSRKLAGPIVGKILPKVMEDAKALGIDLTPGTTGGKLREHDRELRSRFPQCLKRST